MRNRVTRYIEPLAAAVAVHPAFIVHTLGIYPVKQVIRPLGIRTVFRLFRAIYVTFSAELELDLVTLTAPWTLYSQHLSNSLLMRYA
jgi:hypothetical protein